MSKPAIGALVQFCGHEGFFIADIFEIEGVNVVRANGPINTDSNNKKPTAKNAFVRGDTSKCTHHLEDFPKMGFWKPALGIFVVPKDQVTELK